MELNYSLTEANKKIEDYSVIIIFMIILLRFMVV